MKVCSECGLGQLSVDIDPAVLYVTYNWRTSTSNSYLKYIFDFADKNILPALDLQTDWVLELASNDGYLLKYLLDRGVDVLGVDPASNISMYAIASGVPVITEFFNLELAKEIVTLKGKPRWIIANNVLAHTDDIKSFVQGISELCDDKTVVTIENPTIMNILTNNQFETIFHEHYSYLSVSAVARLASDAGLKLFDVEHVPPQGGSNRYWLTKNVDVPTKASVFETYEMEKSAGLTNQESWGAANKKVFDSVDTFKAAVQDLVKSGARVASYAASAKTSTVINIAGLTESEILCVADDVAEKQGKYIPGTGIPVVTKDQLLAMNPTHVIIFAHNIKNELEAKLKADGFSGQVCVWSEL
jgi:2-polyprenyl-3-methyl-5-hydroxy-6-metoxy-1,4-benzoquinol methylase